MLENLESLDNAEIVAKKLVYFIQKTIKIDNQNVSVGASIGISFYLKNSEITPHQLINKADEHMYQLKINKKILNFILQKFSLTRPGLS